jgi:hypothetical protein
MSVLVHDVTDDKANRLRRKLVNSCARKLNMFGEACMALVPQSKPSPSASRRPEERESSCPIDLHGAKGTDGESSGTRLGDPGPS